MSMRKDWNPHDYIPWSDGKNYYALGGQDWDPEQSQAVRGRPGRDDPEPADRGQPAVLSPRDRDELRHGRPVGLLGQPLDRRGEPARHRAARLPRRHPRDRPGRARAAAHRAGDPRLQPRPEPAGRPVRREPVRLRHLRDVPGARHPRLAPQHRQGLQRDDRRPAAAASRPTRTCT